ncbi:hypothetical protein [Halorussus lipolyticus]|uniref:hypothetical protein n=1 Tax=Halorussus lipolyticus TaxID=3034024 RepID=UPI0023E8EEFC|nr:hypothetical protein [Halorussus sp. DT80]
MSNAPSTLDTPLPDERPDELADALDAVRSALDTASKPFEFAGFWSAVVLPALYVPVLVGGGVPEQRAAFGLLLAVHAVALVAGHGYRND